MKKILYIASLFPIIPSIALAQTLSAQGFIAAFLVFINKVLIPFALGIAFLLLVINAVRFFVIHGSDDDGRENARSLALYSVLAFVIIIVFWGIVNLLTQSLGLREASSPTPDYLEKHNKSLKST
jgi:hypothetical protein